MTALAVLTAAGSGIRLGCDGPKALAVVAGRTVLDRAAEGLAAAGVSALVVTAPESELERFRSVLPGHVPSRPEVPVVLVAGGAFRQASVAAGLEAVPEAAELAGVELGEDTPVLVHDAARCLTPPEVVGRVVAAVEAGSVAVVPGIPVTDTLKEVEGVGTSAPEGGPVLRVVGTPSRSRLRAVQTPQGFRWSVLLRAHEHGRALALQESTAATDDAALVEALGLPVDLVEGDPRSLKITTRSDLLLAEMLLGPDPD